MRGHRCASIVVAADPTMPEVRSHVDGDLGHHARHPVLGVWSREALPEWIVRGLRGRPPGSVRIGSPLRAVRDALGAASASEGDLRSFCAEHSQMPILHVGFGTAEEEVALASHASVLFTTEPWMRQTGREVARAIEVPLPGFPHEGSFAQASEFIAQAAAPELLHAASVAPGNCGSLLARLQEVSILLVQWLGMPERVSAASTAERLHRPHESQPDASSRLFRLCEGSIAVTCAFTAGRTASITASNRHWHWQRCALVSGSVGAIFVDDQQMKWRSPTNEVLETPAPTCGDGDESAPSSLLSSALAPPLPAPMPPLLLQRVRAVMEAACLSALTGEAESPESMLRVLSQG